MECFLLLTMSDAYCIADSIDLLLAIYNFLSNKTLFLIFDFSHVKKGGIVGNLLPTII